MVFRNIPLQTGVFGKPHGQNVFFLGHFGVFNHAVTREASNAVENFTSLEIALGHREDVTDGSADW